MFEVDPPYYYHMVGFTALGVTVGEIGYNRLRNSKFYAENEYMIQKYIFNLPNTTKTKIFYINRTDAFFVCERPRVNTEMTLQYDNSKYQKYFNFNIEVDDYQFLLQMIRIASGGLDILPRYYYFALYHHSLVGNTLERWHIEGTPYEYNYLQDKLDMYLIPDLSKMILEY